MRSRLAMSYNSSLATVPVTLQCLHRMNVSAQSAPGSLCRHESQQRRHHALRGDGALFLAQALGYDLSLTSQFLIVAASIIAGPAWRSIPGPD